MPPAGKASPNLTRKPPSKKLLVDCVNAVPKLLEALAAAEARIAELEALIDKKPDGSPAVLHARDSELQPSAAMENLLADLNDSYNAKQGKAWGLFHEESGAYPL